SSGTFATRSPSSSTVLLVPSPASRRAVPVSPAGVPATSRFIVPVREPSASGADQDCVSWIVTEEPTKGRTMSGTRSVGIDSSVRTVNAAEGSPSSVDSAREAPSVVRRISVYSGSAYIAAAAAAGSGRVRVSRSFMLVSFLGTRRDQPRAEPVRLRPADGHGAQCADPYPVCMPSLSKFLADNPGLSEKEADWLQHLVGDWNLLSDLLRSDLVLWIKEESGALAVAHCRPATGSTVYYEDPVGRPSDGGTEGVEIVRLLDGGEASREPTAVEREGRAAAGLLEPGRQNGPPLAVPAAERPGNDAPPPDTETRARTRGPSPLSRPRAPTATAIPRTTRPSSARSDTACCGCSRAGRSPSRVRRSLRGAGHRGSAMASPSSTMRESCAGSPRTRSRPSTASASKGTWRA